MDLDRASAVGDPDDPVLPVDLQLHAAFSQQGEGPALLRRDAPDVGVAGAIDATCKACPPRRSVAAEGVDADALGPPAGLGQATFLGLADLDPLDDAAGQVLLPELGLVGIPHAFRELERAVAVGGRNVQREREQPHHHPLVGLGRVARQGDLVVGVDRAVDVRELHGSLADGRFSGHRPTVP